MDPPGIEPESHPCHGRGLPLSYGPSILEGNAPSFKIAPVFIFFGLSQLGCFSLALTLTFTVGCGDPDEKSTSSKSDTGTISCEWVNDTVTPQQRSCMNFQTEDTTKVQEICDKLRDAGGSTTFAEKPCSISGALGQCTGVGTP